MGVCQNNAAVPLVYQVLLNGSCRRRRNSLQQYSTPGRTGGEFLHFIGESQLRKIGESLQQEPAVSDLFEILRAKNDPATGTFKNSFLALLL